jgi:phage tail-like protein
MRRDDWLIHQLPVGMAEDDFLVRFLTIFQRVADTVVQQIDALPHVFDPAVAPAPMVRTMGQWIGIDWIDSSLDERLQRALVIEYAQLLQWRGTKRGLRRLLRSMSGGAEVQVTDSGGVFGEGEAPAAPPHVRLDISRLGWSRADDLVRVIRQELPAACTFDLWVAGERVWPRPDPVSMAETPQVGVSGGIATDVVPEGDDG